MNKERRWSESMRTKLGARADQRGGTAETVRCWYEAGADASTTALVWRCRLVFTFIHGKSEKSDVSKVMAGRSPVWLCRGPLAVLDSSAALPHEGHREEFRGHLRKRLVSVTPGGKLPSQWCAELNQEPSCCAYDRVLIKEALSARLYWVDVCRMLV